MDVSVKTVDDIADVGTDGWNALDPDAFYSSDRWLRFVANEAPGSCRYVIVERDGRLAAALPVYDVASEDNEFYDPARLVDGGWPGRYLVAGSRRGYVNTVLVDRTLPADARASAVDALLGEIEGQALSAGHAGALLLYLTPSSCRTVRAARPSASPLLLSMDAQVRLPGASFDDYLSSLRKQARTNARREMAAYDAAGIVTGHETIGECCDEAAPLLRQLQARYGHGGSTEHYRAMLRRHADALDDLSLVVTARRSGRLVAFALFYLWGSTMWLRLAGFDYARLGGAFEYFNVAYYTPIAWAYEHGYRAAHLGRESFDAKTRRGATLRPLAGVALPGTGTAPARDWNAEQLRRWRPLIDASPSTADEWARWDR